MALSMALDAPASRTDWPAKVVTKIVRIPTAAGHRLSGRGWCPKSDVEPAGCGHLHCGRCRVACLDWVGQTIRDCGFDAVDGVRHRNIRGDHAAIVQQHSPAGMPLWFWSVALTGSMAAGAPTSGTVGPIQAPAKVCTPPRRRSVPCPLFSNTCCRLQNERSPSVPPATRALGHVRGARWPPGRPAQSSSSTVCMCFSGRTSSGLRGGFGGFADMTNLR